RSADWITTQYNNQSSPGLFYSLGFEDVNGWGIASAPNITAVQPSAAPVSAPITISGTNFGASQNSSTVSFNGTHAIATSWGNSQILTSVPPGATTGSVMVTVGGLAGNGVAFTVTQPPTITNVSPISGAPGRAVTVTGINFGTIQGTNTISFNGT